MSEGANQGAGRAGFGGRAVVTFESRRAAEMASLIERHGGAAVSAPALREVTITENPEAITFARDLAAGAIEVIILLTGVGTRALLEEIAPVMDRPAFVAALARAPHVVARGPKPAAVLRELGFTSFIAVPEPNTWREVMRELEAIGPLAEKRVSVQEYGAPSAELHAALRAEGAIVTPVTVYRWALPEDTTPLRRALHAIADGSARIALFTSRAQVEHAFVIAAEEQMAHQVRERLRAGVVASIGPVCTEALKAEGLTPDLEPEHPKMGHLVKAAAERAGAILAAKGG